MEIVYIAGKYRDEFPFEIQQNIDKAKEIAKIVWASGHVALCPHLNSAHFEGLNTEQHFITGTLALMRRCDSVLLVPGWETSEGTKGEIEDALKREIPVYLNVEEWLKAINK
ncbi:hypothetical protein CMI41_01330 [Candidatus Pacearchaeota archaeon]|nr:hypothetical protein [Candidatus Pacearchaeota archaeon]|tara:strand:- start:26557 stop:26892 length:336 start_codon:yes stop_codon:yes gene_type:complete